MLPELIGVWIFEHYVFAIFFIISDWNRTDCSVRGAAPWMPGAATDCVDGIPTKGTKGGCETDMGNPSI